MILDLVGGFIVCKLGIKNPEIKVFAFDVFEKNIERLKRMAKINSINNIKLFNNAIGNEKGVKIFSVNEKYSPNFSKDLNGKYKIKVYQNKLDNLLKFSDKKNSY